MSLFGPVCNCHCFVPFRAPGIVRGAGSPQAALQESAGGLRPEWLPDPAQAGRTADKGDR